MGIWGKDERKDFFEIENEQIKKNADCVAAICKRDNLIDEKNGYSTLKVKDYGEVFNLCEQEPFRDQPSVAGWSCSGFLVKEDIIATAGYCVREGPVTDLRIVFGYKMSGSTRPVIRIAKKNIYKGVKIIHKCYNPTGNGSNWALVQLDRKVVGQPIARVSEKEIFCDQPVYVIGHPLGLPLKYAPGARVRGIKENFFAADLDVYMGNGGSPVFNGDTHEVIGIVVHGDTRDFRWTGKCLTSVIYPNPEIKSLGPQCTMVSAFIDYVDLSIESSEDYFENQLRKAVEKGSYSEAKEYLQKILQLSTERGERLKKEFENIDNIKKPEEDGNNGNSIFISYSHKDKKYLERLMVHLRPLQKKGIIDIWVDKKLKAGDKWKIEIENALKRARVAILLVSADFLASRFIVDNELPPLLQKAELDGTRIIPVIVKPCRFPRDENLSMFQSINDPSKPIIKLPSAEREKIYDRISNEIEAIMQKKRQ